MINVLLIPLVLRNLVCLPRSRQRAVERCRQRHDAVSGDIFLITSQQVLIPLHVNVVIDHRASLRTVGGLFRYAMSCCRALFEVSLSSGAPCLMCPLVLGDYAAVIVSDTLYKPRSLYNVML